MPCNTALADHPIIQVNTNSVTQPATFTVGMLGIINGILERTTGHSVAAKFSDGEQPVLLGCVEYGPAVTGVDWGAPDGTVESHAVTPRE